MIFSRAFVNQRRSSDDRLVSITTISRFRTSGHERLRRRPVAVMPITDFVDTSRSHSAKDHIRLGEMKRFRKAALTGGRRMGPGGTLFTDTLKSLKTLS